MPTNTRNSQLSTVISTMRLPFLILTPICVLLGVSSVAGISALLSLHVCLVFAGALLAHVSVNMLNEYQDFKSGLDLVTERTPFSGGSGGLPDNPQAAPVVFMGALVALVGVIAIGFLLAVQYPLLWILGVIGSVIILTYTQYINRIPWLCLVAPGVGFGLLMVAGAAIVVGDITGHELSITCAALLAFFMVNNLLLANQFPDIKADAEHGREHLLIKYGAAAGVKAYVITTLLAGLTIVIATILDVWTPWVLLALLPWSLTLKTWMALNSLKENIAQQPEALGLNVVATLLTPLVVSVALLVAP
ncbi:MAG: prenyltransferase [Oceanobacter sp.]|nr:MAG: prenyltransferase [Oceanobacter sp.]